jgi:hypothetical protein
MYVTCIKKWHKGSEEVELSCVTSGSEENKSFAKFTPQGNLRLVIENEALFGHFQPGDNFYVDLTKAE